MNILVEHLALILFISVKPLLVPKQFKENNFQF